MWTTTRCGLSNPVRARPCGSSPPLPGSLRDSKPKTPPPQVEILSKVETTTRRSTSRRATTTTVNLQVAAANAAAADLIQKGITDPAKLNAALLAQGLPPGGSPLVKWVTGRLTDLLTGWLNLRLGGWVHSSPGATPAFQSTKPAS